MHEVGNSTHKNDATAGTRLVDTLVFVIFLVALVLSIATFAQQQLSSDVDTLVEKLRDLREQEATADERLKEANSADFADRFRQTVPHPLQEVGNPQFVGDHAEVGWNYAGDDKGQRIAYEVELSRTSLSTPQLCDRADFFQCTPLATRRFVATVNDQKTRLPPSPAGLAPGTYMWRVAPLPVGSVISAERSADDDYLSLSGWSSPSYFTLYSTIAERLLNTYTVRVGANLQHDSSFSRLDSQGNPVGFDIILIYALIQECVKVNIENTGIIYDPDACDAYFRNQENDDHVDASTFQPLDKQVDTTRACKHQRSDGLPTKTGFCVTLVQIASWSQWQPVLTKKQVDLFIGSVTSAGDRNRNGLVFTSGYLQYETKLYANQIDLFTNHTRTLDNWLQRKRKIGVIKTSSNETLLDYLMQAKEYKTQISKVAVSSFPELESAMDRGEIDGLLIDDTFVRHEGWAPLTGLQNSNAWQKYRDQFLMRPSEEVAIAMILDADDPMASAIHPSAPKFGPSPSTHGLFQALQEALRDPRTLQHIENLCQEYWPANEGYDYKCKVPYRDVHQSGAE